MLLAAASGAKIVLACERAARGADTAAPWIDTRHIAAKINMLRRALRATGGLATASAAATNAAYRYERAQVPPRAASSS